MIFEATIKGTVPSKSNQYRIGRKKTPKGFKPMLMKSYEVREYESMFRKAVPSYFHKNTIDKPFRMEIDVYFRNKRSDIDNAPKVVLDCLQYIGVIKNDNLCYDLRIRKHIAHDAKIVIKFEEI